MFGPKGWVHACIFDEEPYLPIELRVSPILLTLRTKVTHGFGPQKAEHF